MLWQYKEGFHLFSLEWPKILILAAKFLHLKQTVPYNTKIMKELKEMEDQILYRLSNSEGNLMDDVDLIKVLEASKLCKSGKIKVYGYRGLPL